MLTPESFVCDRTCADCCKITIVRLNNEDIKKIRKAGYPDSHFLDFDKHINKPVLRNTNNKCVFLRKKEKRYSCEIYKIRPRVCEQYPFTTKKDIESCKPRTMSGVIRNKGR